MHENQNGFVWLNGEFLHWKDAQVHCMSHSLQYGSGILEGVRAYETKKGPGLFRVHDHTDRLFRSAEILTIKIPYSKTELNSIQMKILIKNNLSSAYVRPMVFFGTDYLGLDISNMSCNVMIAAWDLGHYFGSETQKTGIKVKVSPYIRHCDNNKNLFKAKASGNYLQSVLALKEAKSCGYDETLFLNQHGHILEGSAENIFIVRNQTLYTPKLNSILEGITRHTVITLAKDAGFTVVEKDIFLDEALEADETFFTGTAAEITPISEINDKKIGGGQREITQHLQNLYLNLVKGNNQSYPEWLTYP